MLRDIIRKLKADGRTVLLTTHYMQEADELCDHIAIINKGKIIAKDTPENLKKKYGPKGVESTLEQVFLTLIKKEDK